MRRPSQQAARPTRKDARPCSAGGVQCPLWACARTHARALKVCRSIGPAGGLPLRLRAGPRRSSAAREVLYEVGWQALGTTELASGDSGLFEGQRTQEPLERTHRRTGGVLARAIMVVVGLDDNELTIRCAGSCCHERKGYPPREILLSPVCLGSGPGLLRFWPVVYPSSKPIRVRRSTALLNRHHSVMICSQLFT